MSHQSDLPPHVPSCVSTGAGVTVPGATATPRTDAIKFTAQLWDPEVGEETVVVVFASDYATLERELTAAKAEIAYVREESATHEHFKGEAYKIADTWKARAERAESQLRERTQWQCACGGTDCAGQAENERLRAEVSALKADRGVWQNARNYHMEQADQLRACVAELEADRARLVEVAHDAVSFVGAANYRERQDEAHEMIDAARAGKGAT